MYTSNTFIMKKQVRGQQRTLYFDIDTEVKLSKVAKKTKQSRSEVIRRLIAMTPFDKQVELLNDKLEADI